MMAALPDFQVTLTPGLPWTLLVMPGAAWLLLVGAACLLVAFLLRRTLPV